MQVSDRMGTLAVLRKAYNYLENPSRWKSDGWAMDQTQCLANTLRWSAISVELGRDYVFQQNADGNWIIPSLSDDKYVREAEKLVTVMVKKMGFDSIPSFNDAGGTNHKMVLDVLRACIDLLAPAEPPHGTVVADDVMTKAERKQILREVREIEDEMFAARWAEICAQWRAEGWNPSSGPCKELARR